MGLEDIITVGIDTLSGDGQPIDQWCAAAVQTLKKYPNVTLHLAGPKELILDKIPENLRNRVKVVESNQYFNNRRKAKVLTSDEAGKKEETTYHRLIEAHKVGEVDGVVSANDTVLIANYNKNELGYHPLIAEQDLALPYMVQFPNLGLERTILLDVGGTQDWSHAQSVLFTAMGAALARTNGIDKPRVSFISNGEEKIKGHKYLIDFLKIAERNGGFLRTSEHFEHVSRKEADKILLSSDADVYVTDGFTGNTLIKITAGVGKYIKELVKKKFGFGEGKMTGLLVTQHLFGAIPLALAGLIYSPQILSLRRELDPSNFGGSVYFGLQGKNNEIYVVTKAHGSSNIGGKVAAIQKTIDAIKEDQPSRFNNHFAEIYSSFPENVRRGYLGMNTENFGPESSLLFLR